MTYGETDPSRIRWLIDEEEPIVTFAAMERFANELRRRRKAERLTMRRVSGRSGISFPYISQIEHAKRYPSRMVAKALDDALNANGALLALWAPR